MNETHERVRKYFLLNPCAKSNQAAAALGLSQGAISRIRRELSGQIEERPTTSLQADRSGRYRSYK